MSLVTLQVPGAGLTGQGETLYVGLSCPPRGTPAHSLVTPGLKYHHHSFIIFSLLISCLLKPLLSHFLTIKILFAQNT